MQSLLESIVEGLKAVEGPGAGVAGPALVDGQEFQSLPAASPEDPPSPPRLSDLKDRLVSLRDKIASSDVGKSVVDAAQQLSASALEVVKEVSSEVQQQLQRAGAVGLPQASGEQVLESHPLYKLPWENVERKELNCLLEAGYGVDEVVQALQECISELSKDRTIFEASPPPPSYEYSFDRCRARFATELVLMDSDFAYMRFQLVPSTMSEEVFWMMYFHYLEGQLPNLLTKPFALLREKLDMRREAQMRDRLATRRVNSLRAELNDQQDTFRPVINSWIKFGADQMKKAPGLFTANSPDSSREGAVIELNRTQAAPAIVRADEDTWVDNYEGAQDMVLNDADLDEFEKQLGLH